MAGVKCSLRFGPPNRLIGGIDLGPLGVFLNGIYVDGEDSRTIIGQEGRQGPSHHFGTIDHRYGLAIRTVSIL